MRFNIDQLKQLGQRAKSGQMTREDRRLLVALIESHAELVNLLKDPDTSLADLASYLPMDEHDTATAGPGRGRSDSLLEGQDE